MDNIFFLTRPNYDITTFYLFSWSKELLECCKKKNIKYTSFDGKEVIRENVEKFLKKKKPSLIMFNAHGDEDSLYGHKGCLLIKKNDNSNLLDFELVYARSCKSAIGLGRSVADGSGTYIGYIDDFIFPLNTNKTATPLKDELAGPVLSVSNEVILSLLKGRTAKEAFEKSQDLALKYYYKLANSEADEIIFPVLWALLSNKTNQVLLGDENKAFI